MWFSRQKLKDEIKAEMMADLTIYKDRIKQEAKDILYTICTGDKQEANFWFGRLSPEVFELEKRIADMVASKNSITIKEEKHKILNNVDFIDAVIKSINLKQLQRG